MAEPVSADTWDKLDRVAQARYRIHRLLIVAALIGRRGLQNHPAIPKALTFEAARALLDGSEGWAGHDVVLKGMIEQLARLQQKTPADCWAEFIGDLIPFEQPTFDTPPVPTPTVVPKQEDVFKPLEVRVSTPEPTEMIVPTRYRDPEPEVNPQDLQAVRLAAARRRRQQLLNGGSA